MQQEIRQEIADIERELMLVGRHSVLAAVRRQRPHEALERSAYVLLSRIEAEGPMSISDLAEAFGLAASTVNRQTAAMLRAGLVERILDPDGGLARKLAVTEHGLSRLHQDRDYATAGLAGIVADWDPDDVATLSRLLTRLNASIERREGRTWPRPGGDDCAVSPPSRPAMSGRNR